MSPRWIATMVLALTLAQGCSSYNSQGAQQLPGQKFKTKAGCSRTVGAEKFDSRCDIPILGYSGFSGL